MELFLSQFKLEKRKKISNNIYNWYFQTTYLYLTFSDNKQNFWLIKFFRIYQVLYHHASKLLTHHHAHGYHAIIAMEIVKKGMMCFTYFPIHGRGSIPCYLILGKLWEGLQMGSIKKNIFSSFPCFFLCSLQCSYLFQFFHISISLSIQFWQEHFEEIC